MRTHHGRNTNQHSPQLKDSERMTLEAFLRNNRGINGGEDFPPAFIEPLFHSITSQEITMVRLHDPPRRLPLPPAPAAGRSMHARSRPRASVLP
jgi:Sec7-like guanine-nucleotide exchange factor